MTTLGIEQLTDGELRSRRLELEALAQGMRLHGMNVPERDEAEYLAVREELDRRANHPRQD